MALPAGQLHPEPHSPLFDFSSTTEGGEWIDEIAIRARQVMANEPSDLVIGHGDWSARNVRTSPRKLLAVYDWESLHHAPESLCVGVAAATWTALGEQGEPLAPTTSEIRQYVDTYGRLRDEPFSVGQRRSALAAAIFSLAYTARCEHALTPGVRQGRASGRLTSDADDLVDLLT